MNNKENKIKILFICLGNICRSPSAEAVMKAKVEERGLSDKFFIDSAGISGFHEGEKADARMRKHAEKRGYNLTSLSRPFIGTKDFEDFDYIVCMDDSNVNGVLQQANCKEDENKVSKMTDYSIRFFENSVPDPYYGGAAGFELVLDLLEDACSGLIDEVLND